MKWNQAIIGICLIGGVFVLSGCSAPAGLRSTSVPKVSLLKSTDGGTTFETKDKVSDQQTLGVEVLSMIIDKEQTSRIYVGTRADGIYLSEDGGDVWKKITFPPTKVYGLAQDQKNPNTLYASGVWQERAKLYRSDDRGNTWEEIYSEPVNGTVIISIAQNPFVSGQVIIGLSTGVLVRTDDGGKTWINIPALSAPPTQLSYDPFHANWIYAIASKSLFLSKDAGETFVQVAVQVAKQDDESIAQKASGLVANSVKSEGSVSVATLTFDPTTSNVLYVGTEKSGIWRSVNGGESWEPLNILESSKPYPIRAVAVNPFNRDEIVYSGAQAIYRSTDGGKHWAIYQLNTSNTIGSAVYDPMHQGVFYLGFRAF